MQHLFSRTGFTLKEKRLLFVEAPKNTSEVAPATEENKENIINESGEEKKVFKSKIKDADATVSKLQQKESKEVKGAPEKKNAQDLGAQVDAFAKQMRDFGQEKDPVQQVKKLPDVNLRYALQEACTAMDNAGQEQFIRELNQKMGNDMGWIAVKDGAAFEMVQKSQPADGKKMSIDGLNKALNAPSLSEYLESLKLKAKQTSDTKEAKNFDPRVDAHIKKMEEFDRAMNKTFSNLETPAITAYLNAVKNNEKVSDSMKNAANLDTPGITDYVDSLQKAELNKPQTKTNNVKSNIDALDKELEDSLKKPETQKPAKKSPLQNIQDLDAELEASLKEKEKPAAPKKEEATDKPIEPTFAPEASKDYINEMKAPRARTEKAKEQHIFFKTAHYERVIEEYADALKSEIGVMNHNEKTWKSDPALTEKETARLATLKADLAELTKPEPVTAKRAPLEQPKTLDEYKSYISNIRNWINTYKTEATGANADGGLIDDYWRAVNDEIRLITKYETLWSPDANVSKIERDRRTLLGGQLKQHTMVEAENRRQSIERKKENRVQDPKIVSMLIRDDDLVSALCNASEYEIVRNDLNMFSTNKGYPLSNETRQIAKKVEHLEDLHVWMSREEPRGWMQGDGIEWTFKSGREVTSRPSDQLTNSIGARVRIGLDNGSLSKADLDEYMSKVMKWGQKKKDTFRAALEGRLPTIVEHKPGLAPKIKAPPELPIRPTVAAKRNPVKEIKKANKKFADSPFLNADEKELVKQAASANTDDVTPEMEDSVNAVADRLDTMEAFDRLLDPQTPVKNGVLQWRKSDNKMTEWYFDKHMRRAMLAGRIDEQTATEYFTKHLGMNDAEAANAVKRIQSRVKLTFRDPKKHLRELRNNIQSLTAARKSINRMPQSSEKQKMLKQVDGQLKADQELLTEFETIERESKSQGGSNDLAKKKGGRNGGKKTV